MASEADSFGLVAIASAGAIMSVQVLNIIIGTQEYAVASLGPIELGYAASLEPFWDFIPTALREVIVSLLPMTVYLFVQQTNLIPLERKQFSRMEKEFDYAFIGMNVFHTGV